MPTYLELKEQAEDLMRQAEAARKAEIGAAIADIKKKMAIYGITLADLGGKGRPGNGRKPRTSKAAAKHGKAERKPAKARKPVAAKYRNAETNETWSGRGKPPKWLVAQLAKGRTRDEFLLG